MVRPFAPGDLDALLAIWLEANLQAHPFVPAAYWKSQREAVGEALPQAEVYVWEENGETAGFVGLAGGYIAGIFVRPGWQSMGIGKKLLDRAGEGRARLTLRVYEKNTRAAAFYRREGFSPLEEGTDPATGEREQTLVWTRPDREGTLC